MASSKRKRWSAAALGTALVAVFIVLTVGCKDGATRAAEREVEQTVADAIAVLEQGQCREYVEQFDYSYTFASKASPTFDEEKKQKYRESFCKDGVKQMLLLLRQAADRDPQVEREVGGVLNAIYDLGDDKLALQKKPEWTHWGIISPPWFPMGGSSESASPE